MNFKRFSISDNQWHDVPYYQHKTATDTLTTLPAEIIADGQPIGANLFDKNNFTFGTDTTIIYVPIYVGEGTFTLSTNFPDNNTRDVFFMAGSVSSGASSSGNGVSITTPRTRTAVNGYVTVATRYNSLRENPANYNYMLNIGSTALPYQPYAPTIIKGNLSQSGTPNPSSPIYPSECGDKMANLFDVNATDTTNGYVANGYITSTGTVSSSNYYSVSEYIYISGLSYVNVSGMRPSSSGSSAGVAFYDNSKTLIEPDDNTYGNLLSKSFTVPVNAVYLRISYNKNYSNTTLVNNGSTALPYESYGYKIPILLGGVTTPVYLGQVQSTRRIKKIVFDGTENWYKTSGNRYNYQLSSIPLRDIACVCSHYIGTTITAYSSLQDGQCTTSIIASDIPRFAVSDDNCTDTTMFKNYLAAKYAAGTPVTIWYVLTTETTGIVNEPIRKIGDYADSVSVMSIPTMAGSQ